MENRCLYIVLTRTNTVISKLIHVINNDEYTHAAIALDKELDHMYSFGRKYTFNPFIGVFKHEEINKGIWGAAPSWRILRSCHPRRGYPQRVFLFELSAQIGRDTLSRYPLWPGVRSPFLLPNKTNAFWRLMFGGE